MKEYLRTKVFLVLLVSLFLTSLLLGCNEKKPEVKSNEVLILIDIQNNYFPKGYMQLHEPEKAAAQAAKILEKFRNENKAVIHIKHNFNAPKKFNEINDAVKPRDGEVVIEKNYPSSFLNTTLKEELDKIGAKKLVIVGMMSHMCIDTTVRAAQNYNYTVTLIDDACTTMDLVWHGQTISAETVHNVMMASLNKAFAKVISTENYLSH